jgi:hypothetical protein
MVSDAKLVQTVGRIGLKKRGRKGMERVKEGESERERE